MGALEQLQGQAGSELAFIDLLLQLAATAVAVRASLLCFCQALVTLLLNCCFLPLERALCCDSTTFLGWLQLIFLLLRAKAPCCWVLSSLVPC